MRVMVLPADDGGCGHYRLTWPARVLEREGADVHIVTPGDEPFVASMTADALLVGGTAIDVDERVLAVERPDCDVVVIQRPTKDTSVQLIRLLREHGVRVIVDVDDDFHSVHPKNTAWPWSQADWWHESALHVAIAKGGKVAAKMVTVEGERWYHLPGIEKPTHRGNVMAACREADVVTVTTPALAYRYGFGKARVLPNCVPESYLDVTRDDHPGCYVGWTGATTTHPEDLQETRGGVARAVRETGARFAVVGSGLRVQDYLGLDEPPTACGWVPIGDYPSAVGQLDVGIVPLEPSAFNGAKSWLKGLEMAALGVPFVASPTPEYGRLHGEGMGVLAANARQWAGHVKRYVTNEGARQEAAESGRDAARRWTIEHRAERWWDAWTVSDRVAA